MPQCSVHGMVIDYDYTEKKEIVKHKVIWCKPCIVLMKNGKSDVMSKLYKFTYLLLLDLVAIPVNLQTTSYTLQTSFEHLNDIILGAISTYGDCIAAAVLNALLGASVCSGVMEESASSDAPMDIPFA